MRSAHMIIQLKLLCIAAYEGFVLNTSTVNIEQQLALVHHVGSKCYYCEGMSNAILTHYQQGSNKIKHFSVSNRIFAYTQIIQFYSN